jgi:hypothetical protein
MRWQLAWNGVQLSLPSTLDLFPSLSYSKSSAINENGDICGHREPYSEAFLLVNSAALRCLAFCGQSNSLFSKEKEGPSDGPNQAEKVQVSPLLLRGV